MEKRMANDIETGFLSHGGRPYEGYEESTESLSL